RVPAPRAAAGELILPTVEELPLVANREVLGQVQSREVGFWSRHSDPRHFAVGKIGDPVGSTKTTPSGQFGIEIKLCISRHPPSQKQGGRERYLRLRMTQQAERP